MTTFVLPQSPLLATRLPRQQRNHRHGRCDGPPCRQWQSHLRVPAKSGGCETKSASRRVRWHSSCEANLRLAPGSRLVKARPRKGQTQYVSCWRLPECSRCAFHLHTRAQREAMHVTYSRGRAWGRSRRGSRVLENRLLDPRIHGSPRSPISPLAYTSMRCSPPGP